MLTRGYIYYPFLVTCYISTCFDEQSVNLLTIKNNIRRYKSLKFNKGFLFILLPSSFLFLFEAALVQDDKRLSHKDSGENRALAKQRMTIG